MVAGKHRDGPGRWPRTLTTTPPSGPTTSGRQRPEVAPDKTRPRSQANKGARPLAGRGVGWASASARKAESPPPYKAFCPFREARGPAGGG